MDMIPAVGIARKKEIRLRISPAWLPERFRNRPARVRVRFRFSGGERHVMRRKKRTRPSVWAPRHRVVTYGPLQGSRWDPAFMPHMNGIMDAAFFPSVKVIGNCKAPQTASSAGIETILGYMADQVPGPALIVYPDRDTASKRSMDYLQDMFKLSPRLRKLLTGVDDDMARLRIKLTTMLVYLGWAGSATAIGNVSVRYLILDEVDKYPETPNRREASTMSLVRERTRAFKYGSKTFISSTPTVEEGPVWQYLTTEAQVVFDFHVPCPECGARQRMIWDNVWWPDDARDPVAMEKDRLARYVCAHCGGMWDDRARDKALAGGRWMARDDGRELFDYLRQEEPEKICFHSPAWISQLVSLSESAAAFLRGQGDSRALKYWATQHAAEPWREVVVETDEDRILAARCDLAAQTVPAAAVALTCGIDVQKHCFWFVVRAWARDYASWLIHYGQLATWDDVEELLFATAYPVESGGAMRILRAGIDTGGGQGDAGVSMTEETYFWLRKNGRGRGCRCWGTKGASTPLAGKIRIGRPLDKSPAGKPIPGGLQIVTLDTAELKDALHYRLGQAVDGGPMAAWLHRDTGTDYASQIMAEEKRRDHRGMERWVQTRRDNHLLDCEVIAAAVADPEWPGGGIHLLAAPRRGRRLRSAGVR